MKIRLRVLTLGTNKKSQSSPISLLLLSRYSRIVLIAVCCHYCWVSSLSRETGKLKAVILICWLLPAEGGNLPGERRSSVWVAQQDATTARTSIEQPNLSFKGKSKRASVSRSILRSVFWAIKCIRLFYCIIFLSWNQAGLTSVSHSHFQHSVVAIQCNSVSDYVYCFISSEN